MKQALFLLAGLALLFPAAAQAQTYKPGSLGHLYESCKTSLEHSESMQALHQSLCGAFAEGYFAGITVTRGLPFKPADPRDPCAAEKQAAFDRINGRFCAAALPPADRDKPPPALLLRSAGDILARWTGFLQATAGKKAEPLQKPALEQMAGMLRPGAFCDSLARPGPERGLPAIHPALLRAGWPDVLRLKSGLALPQKAAQCRADLDAAGESREAFSATRCGAEIEGFLAGLHTGDWLQQDREKPSKACARQIERLYKSLDIGETMCVSDKTDPRAIARLFLKRAGQMQAAEGAKFGGLAGLGAVGYETIYRGFLCGSENPN